MLVVVHVLFKKIFTLYHALLLTGHKRKENHVFLVFSLSQFPLNLAVYLIRLVASIGHNYIITDKRSTVTNQPVFSGTLSCHNNLHLKVESKIRGAFNGLLIVPVQQAAVHKSQPSLSLWVGSQRGYHLRTSQICCQILKDFSFPAFNCIKLHFCVSALLLLPK